MNPMTIAAPPARIRTGSDLLRLLPYLRPYRVRWIAMITVAMVSLVATVAIPLMTKAVIDGPVGTATSMGCGCSDWPRRRWVSPRPCSGSSAGGW